MKKIVHALAGIALAGTASAAATALPTPPMAAVPQAYTVDATYDVSLLGLSIGSAHLQYRFANGTYEVRFYGQPEGLASLFTSNAVNAYGLGQAKTGSVTSSYSWVQQLSPKKTQIVEMKYDHGRLTEVVATPAYDPSPDAPNDAQKANTNDPLGGLTQMIMPAGTAAGEKACGTTISIYDGKRAYAFDMWSGGATSVDSGAGGYQGAVLYCVAAYRRIAGWDAKHLVKDSGVRVETWLAPIGRAPGGGPAFYLPVRMWSDASVGAVVAIPEQVTINGKPWQEFFAGGG